MSLIWFRPPRSGGRTVAELAEHLAPFGVVLRPARPFGCVTFRDFENDELVKEIGELVRWSDGRVGVLPRRDASEPEVRLLLCCAEKALHERPKKKDGWIPRRGPSGSWWRTTILRAVREEDEEASAFRSAEILRDVERNERDDAMAPRVHGG